MNNNVVKKTRVAGFVILSLAAGVATAAGLTKQEQLGKNLYFDTNLSLDLHGKGQACESCHTPVNGFVDPDANLPVSEGVIKGLFGGRNAPSASYAMFAPPLFADLNEDPAGEFWIGGQFWDGRATGNPALDGLPGVMGDPSLGDPLADQARGPFLNPVEMANTSKEEVIKEILVSDYAKAFKRECGRVARVGVDAAYDCMALAIAAFERTEGFAPFTSKYDAYLEDCVAKNNLDPVLCATGDAADPDVTAVAQAHFTPREYQGMQLFMNPENDLSGTPGQGAACVLCHVADWAPVPAGLEAHVPRWVKKAFGRKTKLAPPVFTDFSYDNLGVPVNPEIAALAGPQPIDLGLGPVVGQAANDGKFKVMGLRNIAISEPYAHNGFFKSLKEITHFYNTRDVAAEGWAAPEVPATINTGELGNLGLTSDEEDAVVEFMQTLTDGYQM